MNPVQWLFYQGGFSPVSMCLASDSFALTWLIFANLVIGLSYVAIWAHLAIGSWQLSHGRRLVVARETWALILFGAFILACGVGHGLTVLTYVHPYYRLETVWSLFTAAVSSLTAVMLPFMAKFERVEPVPDTPD